MTPFKTDDLVIEVTELKQTSIPLEELSRSILQHTAVKALVGQDEHRLLSLTRFGEDEKEKSAPSFQAVIYNYRTGNSLLVSGPLDNLSRLTVTESNQQPEPTDEEFELAVTLVMKQNERLAVLVKDKKVRIFRPMPPTFDEQQPDGHIKRTICVGVKSYNTAVKSQLLGVSLVDRVVSVIDHNPFTGRQFDMSGDCGIDYVQQPTTSKGTAGRCQVLIRNARTQEEVWRMIVVRPADSSGTKGSGIELQQVYYKGKKVLYRAHVPILNVRYDNDACGPYRDWQYQESNFDAVGTDVAPGIRLCNTPPKTIFQSGNDNTGNFRGVAIYSSGTDVQFISELEAGWYRYISEWHFRLDGTILPRFGFSAVKNHCVCNIHHHHAYWRLDFDIETAGGNRVEEFNNPILVGPTNWHTKKFEIRRAKDATRKRKWKVSNIATKRGYELVPGDHDGVLDSYGVGDVWVLKYRGTELDDHINVVGGSPDTCKAHLDDFVNGEGVDNTDVVLWYGAHFTHDIHQEGVGHIVGPTLSPVNW
jgi:hypothetical protein